MPRALSQPLQRDLAAELPDVVRTGIAGVLREERPDERARVAEVVGVAHDLQDRLVPLLPGRPEHVPAEPPRADAGGEQDRGCRERAEDDLPPLPAGVAVAA